MVDLAAVQPAGLDDLFPVPPEVEDWSSRIRATLARSVEAIIDTGRTLRDAKAALPHGQFEEAVRAAGMSPRAAQMFMRVADNPGIANPNTYSHLPPAYNTLYALSALDPEALETEVESGRITPRLTLGEARTLVSRRRTGEQIAAERAETDQLHVDVREALGSDEDVREIMRLADATSSQFERAVREARADGDLSRKNVVAKLAASRSGRDAEPPAKVQHLIPGRNDWWSDVPAGATHRCPDCERFHVVEPEPDDAGYYCNAPGCDGEIELEALSALADGEVDGWVLDITVDVGTVIRPGVFAHISPGKANEVGPQLEAALTVIADLRDRLFEIAAKAGAR